MSTLKSLLRRFWDLYPQRPLIYVCSHNGVTGAVRAEDYDDEIRSMRKVFKKKGWPQSPVRPRVYPVFLFSDANPPKQNFRTGTLADLKRIIDGLVCAVEYREFELPPLRGPGFTSHDYFGASFVSFSNLGYAHRAWTVEQAEKHLHGDWVVPHPGYY
jgi:hypothetical protein